MGSIVSHVFTDDDIRYKIGHGAMFGYRHRSIRSGNNRNVLNCSRTPHAKYPSSIPGFDISDSDEEYAPTQNELIQSTQKLEPIDPKMNEEKEHQPLLLNNKVQDQKNAKLALKDLKQTPQQDSRIIKKSENNTVPMKHKMTIPVERGSPKVGESRGINIENSNSLAKSKRKTPSRSVSKLFEPEKIIYEENEDISTSNTEICSGSVVKQEEKSTKHGAFSNGLGLSKSEIISKKNSLLQITANFKPADGKDLVKMEYRLNLHTKEETFSSDAPVESLLEFDLEMDKNGNPNPKLFPKSLPKLMNRFEGTVLLDGYLISMDRQQSQRFKVIGLDVYADPPVLMLSPKNIKGVDIVRSSTKFEVRVQSEFGPEDAKWIRIEGNKVSEIKTVSPDGSGKLYILLA